MLIPIPIGARRVASVRGAVWKFVSCTHCQQRYAYLLELEATGEDHDLLFLDEHGAAQRAQAQAERNLLQKSSNIVLPVPCPLCGWYQDDMSKRLKEEASVNRVQIAGLVARRIVKFTGEGQTVAAGQRIGMIRFGSRVDVYLPDGVRPLVAEGQTAPAFAIAGVGGGAARMVEAPAVGEGSSTGAAATARAGVCRATSP